MLCLLGLLMLNCLTNAFCKDVKAGTFKTFSHLLYKLFSWMISNHWETFIKIQTSWISKRTMRILIGGHLNSPWFSDKPSSIFAATSRLFVFARNSRVWGLGLHSIKTLLHIIVTSYDRILLNSEYCPQPQPCNHDSARASPYLTLACFFIDDVTDMGLPW